MFFAKVGVTHPIVVHVTKDDGLVETLSFNNLETAKRFIRKGVKGVKCELICGEFKETFYATEYHIVKFAKTNYKGQVTKEREKYLVSLMHGYYDADTSDSVISWGQEVYKAYVSFIVPETKKEKKKIVKKKIK